MQDKSYKFLPNTNMQFYFILLVIFTTTPLNFLHTHKTTHECNNLPSSRVEKTQTQEQNKIKMVIFECGAG